MNIIFFFDRQINPNKGGTERATYLIAHLLKNRGHNVFYLSVYPVENPDTAITTFFLPDKNPLSEENKLYIQDICQKENIHVIINECGNGEFANTFSNTYLDINSKIITVLHFSIYEGLNYFKELVRYDLPRNLPNLLKMIAYTLKMPFNKYKALKRKKTRFRLIHNHSDKIVLLSKKYISDLKSLSNIRNNDKLISIKNPMSYSLCESPESIFSKKENEILFVGRLSYSEKRVDRLLEIWNMLFHQYPDWRLTIVGDGPDKNNLQEKAKRLGLERCFFEGFQEPLTYYNRAKIFAMTSTHEGLPMVVIEAMQHGCIPILFNSFGAAEEMIDHGVNGFLIPPFNKTDYSNKLKELLQNPDRILEISKKSMEKTKEYDITLIGQDWEDLLNSLF